MTPRVESEILKAFDAIHSLNVIHGDVRAENILVAEDGNTAWIVDFEFAEIIKDGDDTRGTLISDETQVVGSYWRVLRIITARTVFIKRESTPKRFHGLKVIISDINVCS